MGPSHGDTHGDAVRSEEEMIDLVLKFAHEDDGVRAVLMNGSRVNSNVSRDQFQDKAPRLRIYARDN